MKRFWKDVAVEAAEGGWRVTLDGRVIRTPGKRPQLVPGEAMARALAAEWAAQGEEVDPEAFPLRDLADYAIDVVAPDPAIAIEAILPYGDTDTLCYRADEGEALHRRQMAAWEPILRATEARFDVHFTRVSGIVHQAQPPATLARLRAVVSAHDAFTLAALQNLASLAASLTVALAALEPGADIEALWDAANLEEDWQAQLWGKDAQAEARRARRKAGFEMAVQFAAMARG